MWLSTLYTTIPEEGKYSKRQIKKEAAILEVSLKDPSDIQYELTRFWWYNFLFLNSRVQLPIHDIAKMIAIKQIS